MIALLCELLFLFFGLLRRLRLDALKAHPSPHAGAATGSWKAPKPDWVRREVLRMKASMPDAGCRSIEMAFNRRYALASGVTVGKTYVARTLIAHRHAARARRGEAPRPWPHNARWGLDLTSLLGADGRRYWIFGVIEYRSRAVLLVVVLIRKTAAVLARALASAFKRFFGTLKAKLRRRGARSLAGLQRDLDLFRRWYNRVRPHQSLGIDGWCYTTRRLYLTPAEAWYRSAPRGHGSWFEGWDGLLRGYACRI